MASVGCSCSGAVARRWVYYNVLSGTRSLYQILPGCWRLASISGCCRAPSVVWVDDGASQARPVHEVIRTWTWTVRPFVFLFIRRFEVHNYAWDLRLEQLISDVIVTRTWKCLSKRLRSFKCASKRRSSQVFCIRSSEHIKLRLVVSRPWHVARWSIPRRRVEI